MFSGRCELIDNPLVIRRVCFYHDGSSGTTLTCAWEVTKDDNFARTLAELSFLDPNFHGNRDEWRIYSGLRREFFPFSSHYSDRNYIWAHAYTEQYQALTQFDAQFDVTEMRRDEFQAYLRGEISIPGHARF